MLRFLGGNCCGPPPPPPSLSEMAVTIWNLELKCNLE